MRPDAATLARSLALRASALVAELLPAGRRDGAEWRVGSVAGERGDSLGVHLTGSKAGVWADFATGECGDALDLVAAVLFCGDRGQALRWAAAWLGLGGDAPAPTTPAVVPDKPAAGPDVDAERRRRVAHRLWLEAVPQLGGTPAEAYLAGRGIVLAELGRQPRALRFHPCLANRESGRSWPALVAAISSAAGGHIATHRTWLAQRAGCWKKAPLQDAKMTLGSYAGGTVRLWRGASGRSLADASAGEAVAIAEGIETGLSVAVACPHLRVLAAVSLGNLAKIELPPAIATVILCAENDMDNPSAELGLRRAIERFDREGRQVRVARSPLGKDFNDALAA